MRQDQDIINPSSDRRDVMFLRAPSANDQGGNQHFAYGRVLGIFHVNAMLANSGQHHWERFDFLWIRWFKTLDPESPWTLKRLDVLTFPPVGDANSLSFADPADVLRACHIIPRFMRGPSTPPRSGQSVCAQTSNDWRQYLANRYVHPLPPALSTMPQSP
jgi:hypothetical protein